MKKWRKLMENGAKNHATWNGGLFQDEWWGAATWDALHLRLP